MEKYTFKDLMLHSSVRLSEAKASYRRMLESDNKIQLYSPEKNLSDFDRLYNNLRATMQNADDIYALDAAFVEYFQPFMHLIVSYSEFIEYLKEKGSQENPEQKEEIERLQRQIDKLNREISRKEVEAERIKSTLKRARTEIYHLKQSAAHSKKAADKVHTDTLSKYRNKNGRPAEISDDVKKHIQEEYNKGVKVQDLVAKYSVSQAYVYKIIRANK